MADELATKENSFKARGCESAKTGMALMRMGLGAMFLFVFFENLSKGLYGKDGYAGLISYYLKRVRPRLLEEHHECGGQPCCRCWTHAGGYRD